MASLAAFQFASTNLVIELGLVMWILLGWQFVAADHVAGLILIVLLAATYKYAVPDSWFEAAREHFQSEAGVRDPSCGMEVDPTDPDVITLDTDGVRESQSDSRAHQNSKSSGDGTEYFCSESCRHSFQEVSRQSGASWTDRLLTAGGGSSPRRTPSASGTCSGRTSSPVS